MSLSIQRKRSWQVLATLVICLFASAQEVAALNINLHYRENQLWYTGSGEGYADAPVSSRLHGSGSWNAYDILREAADDWQSVIKRNYTLDIYWGWDVQSDVGPSNVYAHADRQATNSSGLIDKGIIRINKEKHLFMDATPEDDDEWNRKVYSTYRRNSSQLLNVGRKSLGPKNNDAKNYKDFYSLMVHEIGHLLGLSPDGGGANYDLYEDETNLDHEININSPLPYAGVNIPIHDTSPGHIAHEKNFGLMAMSSGVPTGVRTNITNADILAIAEVGNYSGSNKKLISFPSREQHLTVSRMFGAGGNTAHGNSDWGTGSARPGEVEPTINKHSLYEWEGVLIPSVIGGSTRVIANIDRDSERTDSMALSVVTRRMDNGALTNATVDLAYFPYANSWKGGYAIADSGIDYDLGSRHSSIAWNDIHNKAKGHVRIEIDGVSNWSGGMLFVTGGGDNGDDSYVSTSRSASHSDSWDVAVRDRTQGFTGFSHSDFSFVYVPYNAPEMDSGGLVGKTGGLLRSNGGDFTITKLSGAAGRYELELHDYDNDEGVLLLTVQDGTTSQGVTAPQDNILTFNTSGSNKFIIEGWDVGSAGATARQDTGFVFAFMPYNGGSFVAVPEPASVISMLIGIGLLAGLRFRKRKSA